MLVVFVETSALYSVVLSSLEISEGGETEVVKKYFRQGQQLMQALSKAGNGCTTIYVLDEATRTIRDKLREESKLLSERGESVRAFIERESGVDGDDQILYLETFSKKVLPMLRIFHLLGNRKSDSTGVSKHSEVLRILREVSDWWSFLHPDDKFSRMKTCQEDLAKLGGGLEMSDRKIIAEACYLARNDLSPQKVLMATNDRVIAYFNDYIFDEFKVFPGLGYIITSLVCYKLRQGS